MIEVGFTLQPDDEFLARTAGVASRADYLEVTPETTWRERGDGSLDPNLFAERFLSIGREHGKPFVAHGVGMSIGTDDPGDRPRQQRWLDRMRADQETFRYRWWTDHLGASSLGGQTMTVPMPLPMTEHAAEIVRGRLDRMREVVPEVGVENTVVHFTIGDPLGEPAFLRAALGRQHHLVLDLHNLHSMSINLGFDPHAWLELCDLDRVIEMHVSGGAESDPRWLRSGKTMRLDGHDGPVPEEVWSLLSDVLPRCRNVRGVTLERMEGTVQDERTARALEAELDRLREVVQRPSAVDGRALR